MPQESCQPRLLVNGNQAVALGKLAAGMSFQTYYPISPATDESVYLEAHETFPSIDGEEASVVVIRRLAARAPGTTWWHALVDRRRAYRIRPRH